MKKVEFIKSYKGASILLNDWLFENDQVRISKLTEILNLFGVNKMLLKSSCFIDEGDTFLKELKTLIDCEEKVEFTKTKLFSKKKYSKVLITFKGEHMSKAVDFIIKKDITLGVDCYNDNNVLALQFVVNDNDGACLTFNSMIFNVKEVKSQVEKIIE